MELNSPVQGAKALSGISEGCRARAGTQLPLCFPCPPCPLSSLLIYLFLLRHLLPVPAPDLHPPTYPNEASRFLTKRNHCQMKYITIKYLILLVSREQAV